MGNSQSTQKISFEDIQFVLKKEESCILINTLKESEQDCLIKGTININKEIEVINKCIKQSSKHIKIIIYGKNSNDEKIYEKLQQLTSLGFYNIFIYTGGLFEWLLLQDIYGSIDFPTTKKELDILRFKPNKVLNIPLLEY